MSDIHPCAHQGCPLVAAAIWLVSALMCRALAGASIYPMYDKLREVVDRTKERTAEMANRQFVVSVMGTTGTGKSSLVNALFGADLKTDPVRPCTKEVQTVKVANQLLFHDLPGIGEDGTVDESYIKQYRHSLLESDVVLWTIHADSRSVAFDQQALNRILGDDPATRVALMSKLTFVLTKADLLSPPPWIYAKSGDSGMFVPLGETKHLLAEKERYFQEAFVLPHARDIVSRTYHEGSFDVAEPSLTADDHFVTYRGILDSAQAAAWAEKYPRHKGIFERLYDNYRVVSCSSLFRYNLGGVLAVVVNKLGQGASLRFQKFLTGPEADQVSLETARDLCNMIVLDQRRNKIVFSMADQRL